jgi:EmrB/QacA subfamily drug resistance transporter
MTAIEITIVATAVPRIVADLGGFGLLSWVFSAYLLTQVVSIPIYGKLADSFGRKPVFLVGIVVFLVGSTMCGLADSMVALIVARFIQGIGGGAVQPVAVTIIGDLYSPRERHKVQGLFGSIFAISSVVGPMLGAFIVDTWHWSWIFYLNLPLGTLAFTTLWFVFHEENNQKERHIDYAGVLFLILGTSALMFALLEGGTAWPWSSWQSLTLVSAFIFFTFILVQWERRANEPILPLWIFKHRLIALAGVGTFLSGAVMIGYTAMIPTYIQGVLSQSALAAGVTLSGMSIGWPLASFTSGFVMRAIGYRKTAIIGSASILIGAVCILVAAKGSLVAIGAAVFVVGLGLGYQFNAYIITLQSSVSWKERGVVTANNMFMRTLGSSVGVAAFGGILNSTTSGYLREANVRTTSGNILDIVNRLLDPTNVNLAAGDRVTVIAGLSKGMMFVFSAAILLAAIGAIFTFLLPHQVSIRGDNG